MLEIVRLIEIVDLIIAAENQEEVKRILEENRVSVEESRYC